MRIDPPADAFRNMAEDRRRLETAEAAERPVSLLRLYQWKPAAVSFGRHQKPEKSLNVEFCRRNGIPMVPRPTGGRAVFHDRELTYALVSNLAAVGGGSRVLETYRLVSGVLFRALCALGVPVEMASKPRTLPPRVIDARERACFAAPSRFELQSFGRKLVGSAQCRLKRAVLQHGSIPLEIDYRLMALALGCEEVDLRRNMISLEEACGRKLAFAEVAEALKSSFLDMFAELHRGDAGAGAAGRLGTPDRFGAGRRGAGGRFVGNSMEG